jgi:DNA polymerase-3 subunit delta
MKLAPDRLAAHLDSALAPLYVVAGDEPLLADEALAVIRDAARRAGCEEREMHVAERSFDWDSFAAGLQNFSLFASRKLVELRLPTGKPGDAGARFLAELVRNPNTANVIVIVLPGLDSATAKSKWASALAEAAVWIEVRTPHAEQMPAWLKGRARRAGVTLDDEAIEALAARVEGNLLAAKQELDKLALLMPDVPISAADIQGSVADGARFDVFQLSDAALCGDVSRAVRVLDGLRREGTAEVLVLWSLVRDALTLVDVVLRGAQGRSLDQALADARVWKSRQDLFRRAARGRSVSAMHRLLDCAARTERMLKGRPGGQPWRVLLELTLCLAGEPRLLAETT